MTNVTIRTTVEPSGAYIAAFVWEAVEQITAMAGHCSNGSQAPVNSLCRSREPSGFWTQTLPSAPRQTFCPCSLI